MIMAKDGRICKVNARDWPAFLRRVVPAAVWQTFLAGVEGSDHPRTRGSPKYVVLCWIAMGWSGRGQLHARFGEGRELLSALFPSRRRPGASYQGLLKASHRLKIGLFGQFWASLRKRLPKRLGALWHWHGWSVLAVDGSRIDAARTRRNERTLGCAGRDKTGPQWWLTWLVHLPTGLIWDWRCGAGTSSERAHLREMPADLPADPLLVADAGFGGFDLLRTLSRAGVDFLVRCGGNTTLLCDASSARIERAGQHGEVYLWPVKHRSQLPLRLRLIVLKRGGRRVYLLTSVLEPQRLSRSAAGDLYQARWGVEVNFRSFKQTLDRRRVLAGTPEVGEVELAGNILALALLFCHAAAALGARLTRLSVAKALRALRSAMEAVRHASPTRWFVGRLRTALRDAYRRKRSQRARDWPHKKTESAPRPPKLRRPTQREKALLEALSLQNQVQLG